MGLFEMFRPKPEKPPVSMPMEKKDVMPEKILSPEEKEIMRTVREFLDLARNIDEVAKKDPQVGFNKVDFMISGAENIMKLYGLDTDFKKRELVINELTKEAASIPEIRKYIKNEDGMVRSSSLDIILRRVFNIQYN